MKEFQKYVGSLQLEDVRKKLTPEMLKKLKWTPEEARQTLKELAEYKQWLREQSNGKNLLGAGKSKLGSVGVTEIKGRRERKSDPIDLERGAVPPGYGDAFRRFANNQTGNRE